VHVRAEAAPDREVQRIELLMPVSPCSAPRNVWVIIGPTTNESTSRLNRIVARKYGVVLRPSVTRPSDAVSRPTNALRDQNVSLAKRAERPVSGWRNDSSANTALRPPPRSSVPRMPMYEVCRPPELTTPALALPVVGDTFSTTPANTSSTP
jgi:hypothetical protein